MKLKILNSNLLNSKPVELKSSSQTETIDIHTESQKETNTETTDTNDLFEGQLVTIGEVPKTECWKFVPLFKEGINGEIRVWQVGFENHSSQLKMVHGILLTTKGENGQLITAYHPIVVNKSGRSLQDQALLEARKRYLDQYSGGYLPKGEELPVELNGKEPMLAHSLGLSNSTKKTEIQIKKYPVSVMPKIDGIRGLARLLPGEVVQIRSRNNKEHESPLTHIKTELKMFLKYLPPSCELDGELYSMLVSFNELSGIIRTKKRVHAKHDLVKFYIFDLIEPKQMCWEERYTLLVNAFKQYLEDGHTCKTFEILQTYTANEEKEIIKYHTDFVQRGYEGLMCRRYACVEVEKCCLELLKNKQINNLCSKCSKAYKLTIYRSNRTNALLKYKHFIDEEVKIIGYSKGTGTEEGAIIYEVKDTRGNVFTCRPRGSMDERRDLYKIADSLIGLPLTIRYQELSEYGVPRFPTGIAIRNYE